MPVRLRGGLALIAVIVAVFPAAHARAAIMMGIDFNTGQLWDIDPSTAAISNSRPTSVLSPIDIAVSPGGTVYSANASSVGAFTNLWTVNRTTGASTKVGATGVGLIEGGLAFTNGGVLYGTWTTSPFGNNLVTLNTSTGAATIVGLITGVSDISAMTFGEDGKLYAIDTKVGAGNAPLLYTINPASGAILTSTAITGAAVGGGALAGLARDPDSGTFYAAFNGPGMLYTLNVSSGVVTPVGSLGSLGANIAGLAFTPEPSAALLLMIGAAAAGLRRRRRAG